MTMAIQWSLLYLVSDMMTYIACNNINMTCGHRCLCLALHLSLTCHLSPVLFTTQHQLASIFVICCHFYITCDLLQSVVTSVSAIQHQLACCHLQLCADTCHQCRLTSTCLPLHAASAVTCHQCHCHLAPTCLSSPAASTCYLSQLHFKNFTVQTAHSGLPLTIKLKNSHQCFPFLAFSIINFKFAVPDKLYN